MLSKEDQNSARTAASQILSKLAPSLIVLTFAFATLPALADPAASGGSQKSGELAFLTTLLSNPIPWVVGLVLDSLIAKRTEPLPKSAITGVMAMVLGYPSIWGGFMGLGSAKLFKMDPIVSMIICAAVLVITLALVKAVSFWVANEKFPAKMSFLMFFGSAAIMVVAGLLTSGFFS